MRLRCIRRFNCDSRYTPGVCRFTVMRRVDLCTDHIPQRGTCRFASGVSVNQQVDINFFLRIIRASVNQKKGCPILFRRLTNYRAEKSRSTPALIRAGGTLIGRPCTFRLVFALLCSDIQFNRVLISPPVTVMNKRTQQILPFLVWQVQNQIQLIIPNCFRLSFQRNLTRKRTVFQSITGVRNKTLFLLRPKLGLQRLRQNNPQFKRIPRSGCKGRLLTFLQVWPLFRRVFILGGYVNRFYR